MYKSLHGKVALITGGSRNIGRNVAMALGAQGADVVLTYREREAEARRAVVELQGLGVRAEALQIDLTGSAQLPKLIDAFKSVLARWQRPQFDILINNAGALRLGSFEEITEADIDHIYQTNYKSVFFLTQKLGPLLTDGGRIVNLGSGTARIAFGPLISYGPFKAALQRNTRGCDRHLVSGPSFRPRAADPELLQQQIGRRFGGSIRIERDGDKRFVGQ
jgi:NAD(P)-dependent dehydrogenase (short-subunit alcohol dehydrogenase family)